MTRDSSSMTGPAALPTSAAAEQGGEYRASGAVVEVSAGSIATTAFSTGVKTVTVRAIRGSTVSVPFNVDRESARLDNLRANGFTVILETASEVPGGSR